LIVLINYMKSFFVIIPKTCVHCNALQNVAAAHIEAAKLVRVSCMLGMTCMLWQMLWPAHVHVSEIKVG